MQMRFSGRLFSTFHAYTVKSVRAHVFCCEGEMIPNFEYLKQLFLSCLSADYRHTSMEGSFACVRDGDLLYIFFEKSNGGLDWINNL